MKSRSITALISLSFSISCNNRVRYLLDISQDSSMEQPALIRVFEGGQKVAEIEVQPKDMQFLADEHPHIFIPQMAGLVSRTLTPGLEADNDTIMLDFLQYLRTYQPSLHNDASQTVPKEQEDFDSLSTELLFCRIFSVKYTSKTSPQDLILHHLKRAKRHWDKLEEQDDEQQREETLQRLRTEFRQLLIQCMERKLTAPDSSVDIPADTPEPEPAHEPTPQPVSEPPKELSAPPSRGPDPVVASTEPEHPLVAELRNMGFGPDTHLRAALKLSQSNLERAVNILLEEPERLQKQVQADLVQQQQALMRKQAQEEMERAKQGLKKFGSWLVDRAKSGLEELRTDLQNTRTHNAQQSLKRSAPIAQQQQQKSESFRVTLCTHIQSMHHLRLLSSTHYLKDNDAILKWPQVTDEADPQMVLLEREALRAQTLIKMVSRRNLVGLIRVIRLDLLEVDDHSDGFVNKCNEDVELIFPTYRDQVKQFLARRQAAHKRDLKQGDVMMTRHSNLAGPHVVFHLLVDSSFDLASSLAVVGQSLKRILATANENGLSEVILPLLLIPESVTEALREQSMSMSALNETKPKRGDGLIQRAASNLSRTSSLNAITSTISNAVSNSRPSSPSVAPLNAPPSTTTQPQSQNVSPQKSIGSSHHPSNELINHTPMAAYAKRSEAVLKLIKSSWMEMVMDRASEDEYAFLDPGWLRTEVPKSSTSRGSLDSLQIWIPDIVMESALFDGVSSLIKGIFRTS